MMASSSSDQWWCLVGPVWAPEATGLLTLPHDQCRVLDGEYVCLGLTLRPGDSPLVEYYRLETETLAGTTAFISRPVFVLGDGVSPTELRDAGQKVRQLAACLSLAWSEPWNVRSAPSPCTQQPPSVPQSWPAPADWLRDPPLPPVEEPLPDIIEQLASRVAHDRALASALSLWHEGILVRRQHPSLALVCFVACIEALAGPEPNERKQFWNLVASVTEPDELRYLRQRRGDIYRLRSLTAHGSRLHGSEMIFGQHTQFDMPPGGWPPMLRIEREDQDFVFVRLPLTQRVSGDLIRARAGS